MTITPKKEIERLAEQVVTGQIGLVDAILSLPEPTMVGLDTNLSRVLLMEDAVSKRKVQ